MLMVLDTESYATDLSEVLAEISEIPVTTDPVDEETTDPELFEEIQDYYPMLPHADRALVRRLEALSLKHPDEPKIRNHLAAAYQYMGRARKSYQIARKIFRDFPDYLFARVNEVNYLLDEGKPGRAFELLGPQLRLRDLYPDEEIFHISELRSYYHAVAEYHFDQGRHELADGIAKFLLELNPDPHPALENLRERIESERVRANLQRMADERARMISVREGREKKNFSQELPQLHHGELEVLYRVGPELEEERWSELLALPRAELRADLETILRDCFSRTAYFRKLATRPRAQGKLWGAIHALSLLGELEARESLPVLLEVLGSPGKTVEFWLGEDMDLDLWQPVCQLVGDDLEIVRKWFLRPGRSWQSRNLITGAVAQGSWHFPERAGEIAAWLGQLLDGLLQVPEEDNVYDTRVTQELVALILDLGLAEHHGLVRQFVERPDFQRSYLGDWEEIESELLADPPVTRIVKRDWESHLERYRRFRGEDEPRETMTKEKLASGLKSLAPDSPPLNDALDQFPESTQSVGQVGRNDPCPCGSGRKYKKCCL